MGLELLAQYNVQRAVDALQDISLRPNNLLWYNRIPLQDAEDGEILAKSSQKVVLADIIANDSKAVVRREEPITLHDIHIPNVKHGSHLNQSELNLLMRLERQAGVLPSDLTTLKGNLGKRLVRLEAGVKARVETMLVGMLTDDFDYDNNGVVFSNITWGMPSALKVTVGTVWSNTASTPIADILSVVNAAATTYGVTYKRITMRRSVFNYIVKTTEFKDLAKLYSQLTFPSTFPTQDTKIQETLLTQMLGGMVIEFYDSAAHIEAEDGSRSQFNFLNPAKVILSDPAFDGDANVWDVANGIVTETLVAGLMGMNAGVIGGFGSGPQRGPVGYATAPPDLNPPNITLWDVMRCFPRKTFEYANACLTVL